MQFMQMSLDDIPSAEFKNTLFNEIVYHPADNSVKHMGNFLNCSFTFIDLFAGIGGFRVALEDVGGTCVGFSEIDKHCVATYQENFNEKNENSLGNVTKIEKLPYVDLIVGGVPCQSWSVAGKMLGFDDPRGMLWYDTIRLVESSKPKAFVFENVKGLYDQRNRHNLELILKKFKQIGYFVNTKLLNSYDFGVPQIRSRIFIVGFRKDFCECFDKFSFPSGTAVHENLAKYLDDVENREVVRKKFSSIDLFGEYIPKARNPFQKEDELNDFFVMCDTRNGHTTIHSWDIENTTQRQKEIMLVFMKNRRRKKFGSKDGNPLSYDDFIELMPDLQESELESLVEMNLLRKVDFKYEFTNSKNSAGIGGVYRMYMPHSKIFSTLTATGTKDVVVTDYINTDSTPQEYKNDFITNILRKKKYRPLTVAETQRIQGFPESFIPNKDETIAKRQFGNAVSPPVIKALAIEIIKTGVFNKR